MEFLTVYFSMPICRVCAFTASALMKKFESALPKKNRSILATPETGFQGSAQDCCSHGSGGYFQSNLSK
jgi:hypothetical protein